MVFLIIPMKLGKSYEEGAFTWSVFTLKNSVTDECALIRSPVSLKTYILHGMGD